MFGAPATSPFGAPAPAPFGAAPTTPFGAPAPSAFGAAPATGAFGAPAPSAFGAPAPTAFGAPSTFGAPAAGGFGAPAPATSVFGAPSGGFGAAAPAPAFGAAPATTGLFGAPAPAAGGFGAAPAAGGFGMKPAGGGLFGAAPTPAPATSIFGAPAPAAGGLFGAPAPAPTGGLFGAPAPAAPAFGSPAPSAFGAAPAPAFGAAPATPFGAPAQTTAGTAALTQFQPTSKQDGTSTIQLQSITALPQYESKSFEELRLEDYMAGNKGSQSAQQSAPGGFGAPATPAFGAPAAGGLFGAPAAAPTGGGLFGSPAPAAGGLFGAPAPAAPAPAFGGFGAAPTPAPAFGAQPAPAPSLFGAPAAPTPAAGGLFGSPAPAPAFGAPAPAFGAAPAAPAFGAPQPAPAAGGLFGAPAAPAPAAGGLFGAPAPAAGGLFGAPAAAPKPGGLFGSPAPAAGGLFGAPAPAPAGGGLFGAPAAPAPAAGGLFGAPAAPTTPAAGGGLFGSTATPAPAAGGLFGAPAPAPAGGLFGAPAAAPAGGLFGAAPAAAPQPVAAAPIAPTPSADVLLAQQLAAVENQRKQLELTDAWRGNPPSGSKVIASSLYDNPERGWDSYTKQSSALMSYRAVPRSAAKIRPRGFTPSKQSPITANALKSGGSRSSGSPILSPNRFIGSATKSLIIKPGSLTPKPKTRLLLTNGVSSDSKDTSVANLENGRFESPRTLQYPTQDLQSPTPADSVSPRDQSPAMNGNASPAHDFYRQVVGSPNDGGVLQATTSPRATSNVVPTLSKAGYTVHPPIQDLAAMSEADLAAVSGFKVERPGHGSVEWDGAVDVRGVDLDSTVDIENGNVSVYDSAELNGNKPARGSKLNRPAVITMHQIYPSSGSTSEQKAKFSKKIMKSTKKMGAEFISFDVDSGIWKFRVGHFSRYGLDDVSDDDSDDEVDTPSLATFDDDEKNELGGASKFCAPTSEDDSTTGSVFTHDMSASGQPENVEDEEEMEILRDGDNAYAMMTEELVEYADALELQQSQHAQEDENLFFPNEAEEDAEISLDLPIAPPARAFPVAASGICSKLANKSGLTQTSSIDYGLRMRRSFRVGWRPDGSFLHLKPTSDGKQILVQSKPLISAETSNPIHLLKTHQNHSHPIETEEEEAPLRALTDGVNSAVLDYIESSSSYSLKSATKQAVWSSFSLIDCLYGDYRHSGDISQSRRLEAVSSWLKRVVADDASKDISTAQSTGDSYGSIFAALSGGDMAKASSLALNGGNSRLSLMLASSGVAARSLYESQLEMWNESGAQSHVPSGLLRIFSLTRGSMDTEQSLFKADSKCYTIDWRRRFGMYLWSCRSQDETEVSTLVNKYRSDVSNGLAPVPLPIHAAEMKCTTTPLQKCVLYEILNQYSGDETSTLANIVSPLSHTKFQHDYSASFHLAAVITATTGSSLTLNEENIIIDSISSQLIMSGSWEWAVYASLSAIGSTDIPKSAVASRLIRARNIICMFYNSSKDHARRSFLENIGVPSEWFSAAVAYRSGNEGRIFDHVQHLMHFSTADALSAIENLIIPHYILGGDGSSDELRGILESFAEVSDRIHDLWEGTVLCKPVYESLRLTEEVEALCSLSPQELKSQTDCIESLIVDAAALQNSLSEYREICKEQAPLVKVPLNYTLTPRYVYLAEICTKLSNLQLQLLSLKNGTPFETNEKSSGLAFALNAGGLFGSGEVPADSGSILRGICGFSSS